MRKALFIPWSFTLLETYFPIADALVEEGFEVYFLNQLYDPRSEYGIEKMTNRMRMDYYKRFFGFSEEVKPLNHLAKIRWIDVDEISEILYSRSGFKVGYAKKKVDFPVSDYDLVVMRTEYDTWPIMYKWMTQTRVVGAPVRMMNTEVNKKARMTGYVYFDWCFEAKNKFRMKKDHVLFFHDGGTRAIYDVSKDGYDKARAKQFDYLSELCKIVVLENNKDLIIRLHPQGHEWAGFEAVERIVSEICEKLSVDRGKIEINVDRHIGRALAEAEVVILPPGASSVMKALMFDCHLLMLNFPRHIVNRKRGWYMRKMDRYLSAIYVNSFQELRRIFQEGCFPDHKESRLYEFLVEYFDGESTNRLVDYVMENLERPLWKINVEAAWRLPFRRAGIFKDFV